MGVLKLYSIGPNCVIFMLMCLAFAGFDCLRNRSMMLLLLVARIPVFFMMRASGFSGGTMLPFESFIRMCLLIPAFVIIPWAWSVRILSLIVFPNCVGSPVSYIDCMSSISCMGESSPFSHRRMSVRICCSFSFLILLWTSSDSCCVVVVLSIWLRVCAVT